MNEAITEPRVPLFGCGRCPARWGGKKQTHCGSCHETFSGIWAFDKHRSSGMCVKPPWKAGLVRSERVGYTLWAIPGSDERWDREKEDDDE